MNAITALHFASWKAAYVNVFPPENLVDGGALQRQMEDMWQGRARDAIPDTANWMVTVAEDPAGQLAGFVCVNATEEREYGILLDNLHVSPAFRRKGIASALVRRAAQWVSRNFPGQPMHLTCLDTNDTARAFYEAVGGRAHPETTPWEPEGGAACTCIRYVWDADSLHFQS